MNKISLYILIVFEFVFVGYMQPTDKSHMHDSVMKEMKLSCLVKALRAEVKFRVELIQFLDEQNRLLRQIEELDIDDPRSVHLKNVLEKNAEELEKRAQVVLGWSGLK